MGWVREEGSKGINIGKNGTKSYVQDGRFQESQVAKCASGMKRLEENVECKDRTAHAPAIVYHNEVQVG